MASDARGEFKQRMQDVEFLMALHSKEGGKLRGRRSDSLTVLHRSALVLLTASWEEYIESVSREGLRFLAREASGPEVLPVQLRAAYLAQTGVAGIDKDKHELRVWNLAGDGWKSAIIVYAENRLKNLNTPKSEVVISLLESLFGIPNITASWNRQGLSAAKAITSLDDWLVRRHEIAHGAQATPKATRSDVTTYKSFLDITVMKTDESIRDRIKSLVGRTPW